MYHVDSQTGVLKTYRQSFLVHHNNRENLEESKNTIVGGTHKSNKETDLTKYIRDDKGSSDGELLNEREISERLVGIRKIRKYLKIFAEYYSELRERREIGERRLEHNRIVNYLIRVGDLCDIENDNCGSERKFNFLFYTREDDYYGKRTDESRTDTGEKRQ